MPMAYADSCFTETPNDKVWSQAQAKGKSVTETSFITLNKCYGQWLNRVFSGTSQKAPARGKKAKDVEKAKPEEKKEDAKPEEEKTPAENGETKADEVSPEWWIHHWSPVWYCLLISAKGYMSVS